MTWTPIEEEREDAAQYREYMRKEGIVFWWDPEPCPHAHTVEEVRDTRRMVAGDVEGDIDVVLVCTDCGKEFHDHYPGAPGHPAAASEPPREGGT